MKGVEILKTDGNAEVMGGEVCVVEFGRDSQNNRGLARCAARQIVLMGRDLEYAGSPLDEEAVRERGVFVFVGSVADNDDNEGNRDAANNDVADDHPIHWWLLCVRYVVCQCRVS